MNDATLGSSGVPSYPENMAAVTPHDTNTFTPSIVWTTDGGDIEVICTNGSTLLIEDVPAGGEIKGKVIGVTTDSTATKIYRSW